MRPRKSPAFVQGCGPAGREWSQRAVRGVYPRALVTVPLLIDLAIVGIFGLPAPASVVLFFAVALNWKPEETIDPFLALSEGRTVAAATPQLRNL